ncbi:MAG: RNA methyltransferase [bacterium]|nr:RNA methyltransferase [bacterium]
MTDNMPDISIVLVNPKTSANIGAAARAMNCMGLKDMVLVSPRCQIDREAFSLAVGSDEILSNARITDDLEGLLEGYSLIAGTTKKMGKKRLNFVTASEFSSDILPLHAHSKTALLFGAEDYGLPMSAIKLCQHLVYIPVSQEFGSLNLSQAVMVMCYEIRKSLSFMTFSHGREKADSDDMERLCSAVAGAVKKTAYPEANGFFNHASHLKEILSRASLTKFELHMMMGFARHACFMAERISALEKRIENNGMEKLTK